MCGIALFFHSHDNDSSYPADTEKLRRRGPDSYREIIVKNTKFAAAVLHIQGSMIVEQPYVDKSSGDVLLWNGEVFGGIEIGKGQSDTVVVSSTLSLAMDSCSSGSEMSSFDMITSALAKIEGPYAFIFYHAKSDRIIYGRDPFGRRSLVSLRARSDGKKEQSSKEVDLGLGSILGLCSVCPDDRYVCQEVGIGGLYLTSLTAEHETEREHHFLPWPASRTTLGRIMPADESKSDSSILGGSPAARLLEALRSSITRRVRAFHYKEKRIGVLFSGGIDSVVLAALLHICLVDLDDSGGVIELINVAFIGSEDNATHAPDRLAAIASLVDLRTLFPMRQWKMIEVDITATNREEYESAIVDLIKPCDTHMDLNIGTVFWFASRGKGRQKSIPYTQEESNSASCCTENGRKLIRFGEKEASEAVGRGSEDTAKNNISEIESKCFVQGCNRPPKQRCPGNYCSKCCFRAQKQDGNYLCSVHKSKTKPATSRSNEYAEKLLFSDDVFETCETTCSALLVGIGADEQMAGYGRHRTIFLHGGYSALCEEMNVDLSRLWLRNLGRDDRCISDHGREAWFPYLDEEVVSLLQSLPLHQIARLDLGLGEGDKRILREVARMIGLTSCNSLVKRAVQFGTRIARDTNKQHHGSNRKGKGDSKL